MSVGGFTFLGKNAKELTEMVKVFDHLEGTETLERILKEARVEILEKTISKAQKELVALKSSGE